jgi:hypothetical protein
MIPWLEIRAKLPKGKIHMAENQATIIPAQPDYELLVCWFLPDGKINVTRTPILGHFEALRE